MDLKKLRLGNPPASEWTLRDLLCAAALAGCIAKGHGKAQESGVDALWCIDQVWDIADAVLARRDTP